MDLVTGAIGNLGPKLLQLVQDEYKLQKGVKEKIEFVSEELESIHGALRKVAAMPPDQVDEQAKIWARQVREASYVMEDTVDSFLVRVEGQPEQPADRGWLKSSLKKMSKLFMEATARHDIASAIEDIENKLQKVAERRARYKIDEMVAKPAANSTIDPRLEAMYKDVTQLVGIDKAMGELMAMLSLQGDEMSNERLKIVSVCGVGGLGKTTLAKAVHDKLKPQFDCGAFVPVGRNPDLKKVFRDILIDLGHHVEFEMSMLDQRQLTNKLRDFLGSKRYFIVIDDVWDSESWKAIKQALVENNKGSRIISTTRNLALDENNRGSRIISTTHNLEVKVYKQQSLSYDDSKRLFYTRIFGSESKWPDSQVDEVFDKILKKCDGVPLAIITMASLLVDKPREEWSEVCKSVGFRDKGIEQVERTMHILSLSYYDLPCHLRTCLLYLSAFPEDHIIDKHSLIWKWVAEGFVHKTEKHGLFEIGEGYFYNLVNRSMIQAVESGNGIIDGCRVHDMVLDLIRCLSREENFITVLNNDEGMSSISRARRLAHQNTIIEHTHLDNHKGMPKLRSFIAHSCQVDKGLSLLRFELLRVLALENVNMSCCPDVKKIGNLLHLRHLRMKNTGTCELPKEIGALKFLQILDLYEDVFSAYTRLKELPSSVGLLTQLVCLRVHGIIVPDGIIKKLTSLEELQVAYPRELQVAYLHSVNGHFMKDLHNLTELRVLRITATDEKTATATCEKIDESMESDLLQSVGNLHKIQRLEFDIGLLRTDVLDTATFDSVMLHHGHLRHLLLRSTRFCRLPSRVNRLYLPNISHLQLWVIALDEQGLKILGELPKLRYLKLSTLSTVTVANIAVDGCFRELRSCEFDCSLVQFAVNEDSSVSFTLWKVWDSSPVQFDGSRKKDECIVAPAIMPNLRELSFLVDVRSMVECRGGYNNLGLEYLTSLQKVTVDWRWEGCFDADVIEAEAALRHAIGVHPGRPTYHMSWYSQVRFEEILQRAFHPGNGDEDLATEVQEDEVSSPVDDDVTGSRKSKRRRTH